MAGLVKRDSRPDGMPTLNLNGVPASPSALPYTLPPTGMFGARPRPQSLPLTADPGAPQLSPLPQINLPPAQIHHAFFGEGGTGRKILSALGEAGLAFSAGQGDPYSLSVLQSRQRLRQTEAENAGLLQRQMAEMAWKREHPEPTAIQRNHDYFVRLGRQDLADSYLNAEANPQSLMTDPTTGQLGFYPKGGTAPNAPAGVPSVTDDEAGHAAYAKLPKGAQFRTPDGVLRVKG